MTIGMTAVVVQRIVGTSAANAFFYPGTIGVLSRLVAYIVTNVGAHALPLHRAAPRALWQVVIPDRGHRLPGLHHLQEHRGHGVPLRPASRSWVGAWAAGRASPSTFAFPAWRARSAAGLAERRGAKSNGK
jgi:hypothetical protein